MTATAFASSQPLDAGALERAPLRYPRPSRLQVPLELDGAGTDIFRGLAGPQQIWMSHRDLVAAVQSGKPGDQLTLTLTRDGSEKQVTVTLAEAS